MNPSIATSIAAQHRRELLATAAHYRRIRPAARPSRARKAAPDGAVRGHPQIFQTWLAAGRL
ncbi:MAG: hypothetical protein ABI775_01525 [Pseudonocardiales bacterium]|nr:hypothetical protein [Actinomycetota bacterium]